MSIKAREKFKVGDRVVMTEEAIKHLYEGLTRKGVSKPTRGIVAGFPRDSEKCVSIIPDGLRSRSSYHIKFWNLDGAKREPQQSA